MKIYLDVSCILINVLRKIDLLFLEDVDLVVMVNILIIVEFSDEKKKFKYGLFDKIF